MSAIEPISPSTITSNMTETVQTEDKLAVSSAAQDFSFAQLIAKGIENVESKIEVANTQVKNFAMDDTVPIHQVTIALEEARLSVELALQVRARLVESYREIMNMQL